MKYFAKESQRQTKYQRASDPRGVGGRVLRENDVRKRNSAVHNLSGREEQYTGSRNEEGRLFNIQQCARG